MLQLVRPGIQHPVALVGVAGAGGSVTSSTTPLHSPGMSQAEAKVTEGAENTNAKKAIPNVRKMSFSRWCMSDLLVKTGTSKPRAISNYLKNSDL